MTGTILRMRSALASVVRASGRTRRAVPGQDKTTHVSALVRRKGFSLTWVALFLAAGFEVVWALALKQSDGFSNLRPSLIFLVASTLSIILLALALRELPVGTAYAIWTGTGAVGTAIVGMAVLNEPATASRILPIALIAIGISWLALATE